MLEEVNQLELAAYIEPVNAHPSIGVTNGKIYDLHLGKLDRMIGDEYHVIDDYGKRNVGVLFYKFKMYKNVNN